MAKKTTTVSLIILSILFISVSQLSLAGIKGIISITDQAGKTVGIYKKSHALVIGVSDYVAGWPDLPGVDDDLKAVKKLLEKQGFNVTAIKDPTHKKIREAFDQFISQHGREFHDRLLIYYAGHGYTLKQKWGGEMGYIVPSDTPVPRIARDAFLDKAIDMEQIAVYAKRIQSKHVLFLFDCCFSGSIFTLSRAAPAIINYKTSKPVRQFITAGSADERVPDQSVFRRQFEDALKGEADSNKDGYVTGSELGEYLQTTVVNYSNESQHPQYGKIRHPKLDKGDFVFVLGKAKQESVVLPSLEKEEKRIAEEKEKLRRERERLEQERKLLEERKAIQLEREKLEADRYASLEGVWEDEDSYRHTIRRVGNRYTVVSVVSINGKSCEVSDIDWHDGILKWTFHIPWSGYTLHYSTKVIEKDQLKCDWTGPDGSGADVLKRVR